jgi:hypothetical protein
MIAERLPGTSFGTDPSGAERLAWLDRRGVDVPPELRNVFAKLPADERGMYEGEGVYLEFFLGTDPIVKTVSVDARGSGDPIPVLRRLCAHDGWQIRELGGTAVDLQADDAGTGWAKFTQYRDKGVEELRKRGTNL